MEETYKRPCILRLMDISLDDYVPIEDVADGRLLSTNGYEQDYGPDAPAPESVLPADKIPATFTGLDSWPLTTNLRCWACHFTHDNSPKFCPTYVREAEDSKLEMGVKGSMCTVHCVARWIITRYAGKTDQKWRALDNLCLLYFVFTGFRIAHVVPAYEYTELKQYGGDWDEETFWKKMRALDPVAGLRDHTPGSIVPERERMREAVATLRAQTRIRPLERLAMEPLVARLSSVWDICGARDQPVRSKAAARPTMYESPAMCSLDSVPVGGAETPSAIPKQGDTWVALDKALKVCITSAHTDAAQEELEKARRDPEPPHETPGLDTLTGVSASKPSASKPIVSASKPTVSASKPAVSVSKPAVSASKPAVSKPAISASKPAISASKPAISASKPAISASKPAISASKPAASAGKPATGKAVAAVGNITTSRPASMPVIRVSKPVAVSLRNIPTRVAAAHAPTKLAELAQVPESTKNASEPLPTEMDDEMADLLDSYL
jgi:hypothetical protein